MAIVFLSLGSNMGERDKHLREARDAILTEVGEIIAESSVYENEAVGFEGNSFYNQVIKVKTKLLPENLLQKTQEIERKMGRTQKTIIKNGLPIYSSRIIDIDILLYDDLQIDTEMLIIPHPKMYEREFVMKLLLQLETDLTV